MIEPDKLWTDFQDYVKSWAVQLTAHTSLNRANMRRIDLNHLQAPDGLRRVLKIAEDMDGLGYFLPYSIN